MREQVALIVVEHFQPFDNTPFARVGRVVYVGIVVTLSLLGA